MYQNIGKKIKGLAVGTFVTEAIAAIIGGIYMIIEDIDYFPMVLLLFFFGPIVAWVSSWLLYGFGELIDKTCDIAVNTRNGYTGNSGNFYNTTAHQVQNEKSYFNNYNTVTSSQQKNEEQTSYFSNSDLQTPSQTKSAEERGRTYYDSYGINTPLHQRPREKEKSYFDNQSLSNYKMSSLPDDENK